jgi:hypothetical protein
VARWISTRQPGHKPVIEELGRALQDIWLGDRMLEESFSPHCVKARKGNESPTIGSNEILNILAARSLPKHLKGGRVRDPDKAYENRVHPLSYRSLG